MLINLSNHPSDLWGQKQLEAAQAYGEIVDLPFPVVSPEASHRDVQELAETYVGMIERLKADDQATIHVMGEMTFTYAVVSKLKEMGLRCVASTTVRNTAISGGIKVSEFSFVTFREY